MAEPLTAEDIESCQLFHLNSGREVPVNKQYCVRRNGRTKKSKKRPAEFKIPVKFGLYQYGYIDHTNAHLWHAWNKCPLLDK